MTSTTTPVSRTRLAWGAVSAIVGLSLFVYFVQRAGLSEIAAGVRRLGWIFLMVVAIAGLRFAARGMAWRSCLMGPHQLSPSEAFRGVAAGDMLGNLTPLSILVSEPSKALFVNDSEPVSRTLPALAVENLFYTLSAVLVIAGGALALMLRQRTSETWWLVSVSLVAGLIVLISVAHAIIWWRVRVASRLCAIAGSLSPAFILRWTERVRQLEDRVFTLYPRDRGRLLRVAGWELSFHALAVLEIYLVLSLISADTPTLVDAFIFESTNRFINVVFKVVPMRLGVDEAGTGAFAEFLAFGTATGVTLAVVRKARMLVWMAAGAAFLLARGLSINRVMADAVTTRADVTGRERS